jgi:hypothetical protein
MQCVCAAGQRYFPSIRPQETQKNIEKGALAATRGTHDADKFSSDNFEAEIPKRGYGLSVLGFEDQGDVCGLYERCMADRRYSSQAIVDYFMPNS